MIESICCDTLATLSRNFSHTKKMSLETWLFGLIDFWLSVRRQPDFFSAFNKKLLLKIYFLLSPTMIAQLVKKRLARGEYRITTELNVLSRSHNTQFQLTCLWVFCFIPFFTSSLVVCCWSCQGVLVRLRSVCCYRKRRGVLWDIQHTYTRTAADRWAHEKKEWDILTNESWWSGGFLRCFALRAGGLSRRAIL